MAETDEHVPSIGEIDRLFSDVIEPNIRFIPTDPRETPEQLIILLYASALAFCRSALSLCRQDQNWQALPLLRTALEAWVDMINLSNNPDYSFCLASGWHRSEKLRLEAGLRGNAYFASVDRETLQRRAQQQKRVGKALKNMQVRLDEPKARFSDAGLAEVYDGVYLLLCSHSHNGLAALEQRFLNDSTWGTPLNNAPFWENSYFSEVVLGGVDYLGRNTSFAIHTHFKTGKASLF